MVLLEAVCPWGGFGEFTYLRSSQFTLCLLLVVQDVNPQPPAAIIDFLYKYKEKNGYRNLIFSSVLEGFFEDKMLQ